MFGTGLLRLLASLLLPRDDREFILGDIEELYARRAGDIGTARAFLRALREVLSSSVSRRIIRHRSSQRGRAAKALATVGDLRHDVRHAFRSLARRPSFVVVAALTLGVGVGSAGAVFGIIDQYVLQAVPGVGGEARPAMLEFRTSEQRQVGISWAHAAVIREGASLPSGLAGFSPQTIIASTPESRPVQVHGYAVYGEYFEILEVRPATGRLLTAPETGPTADPTQVVISEHLWSTLFGRADDVVGKQVTLNGVAMTVLGVADDTFRGTDRFWPVDLWMPYSALTPFWGYSQDVLVSPETTLFQFFIVGQEGATLGSTEQQVGRALEQALSTLPNERLNDVRAAVLPGLMDPTYREFVSRAMAILTLVVGLVLLIPCANVANLLLVRGAYRRSDFAIRRALGASRLRIAGQLLLENLALAVLGATAGLGIGWVISLTYQGHSPWGLPALEGLVLSRSAVFFAACAVIVTTLIFGVLPAAFGVRFDLSGGLRSSSQHVTGSYARIQRVIATLQIALVLPLLLTALLLAQTLREAYDRPLGLAPQGIYATSIDSWVLDASEEEYEALQRQLIEVVEAVPGVHGVALDEFGPYARRVNQSRIVGAGEADTNALVAHARWASPGWFRLLGIQLLSGRPFGEGDWRRSGPPSVILTAPLARRLFGGTDGVGRSVKIAEGREFRDASVVGVVGDVRVADPKSAPDEIFFLSYPPVWMRSQLTVLAGASRTDGNVQQELLRAIESVMPEAPVSQPETLTGRIDSLLGQQRLFGQLSAMLSALAIAVTAVGLYGVVASTIAYRRREFGIRIALGAPKDRIVRHALRPVFFILAAGTLFGTLGASALGRLVESLLVDVSPFDVPSYAVAIAAFGVVAILTCWMPARKAAATDPLPTLRAE